MTIYKGYIIKNAKSTGGKAGKGHNKTSTIQVMKDNMLIKHFRFLVGNSYSEWKAKEDAKQYIDILLMAESLEN